MRLTDDERGMLAGERGEAVRRAIDMRGCFVEHNEFGNDPAVAAELDRQLKANCSGAS